MGPTPFFSCYWHMVVVTGDLFKLVHLRTYSSLVLTSSCGLRKCGSIHPTGMLSFYFMSPLFSPMFVSSTGYSHPSSHHWLEGPICDAHFAAYNMFTLNTLHSFTNSFQWRILHFPEGRGVNSQSGMCLQTFCRKLHPPGSANELLTFCFCSIRFSSVSWINPCEKLT